MKRERFGRIILPGAVATVLAAIIVGLALGGMAAAVETPPENTAAPTISPLSPIRGDTETASQGSWTGSPTSFTYAWYRCKGLESCASIAGANKSSYTPVKADVGSTLRVLVMAANGAGSGFALSAATNVVVGPPYWYSCNEVGAGTFEDSACTKGTKGPFEWAKVVTGTSTPFQLSGSSPVVFSWTLSGLQTSVSCSSQSGSGTLENPTGGGAGRIAGTTLKLSGCTVAKPAGKGCKVTGGSITTTTLEGVASESEGKPLVKIQPASGTTIFNLTLQECSISFLNNTFAVTGSFGGISVPSTSSLEFTAASTTALAVGGSPGSLEGTLKIQTASGARALKLF